MKRRSRMLWFAKWGGLAMCSCVVIASIASMWRTVVWNSGQPDTLFPSHDRNPNGGVEFGLSRGLFWVGWRPPMSSRMLLASIRSERELAVGTVPRHGWTVQTHACYFLAWPPTGVILPMAHTITRVGRTTTNRWIQRVTVPLWLPLLLIAIPTALLCRRDRPLPRNRCLCGYNLTGNLSGTCPECGERR